MYVLLYSDSRDDGTRTRQSREGCRCTGPGVTGGRVTDSRGSRTSFRAAISFLSYRSRPPAPRYRGVRLPIGLLTSPQSAYPCVSGRAERSPRPPHCQQSVDTDPGRVYGIGTAARVSTHPRIYRCWRRHVCHARCTRARIGGRSCRGRGLSHSRASTRSPANARSAAPPSRSQAGRRSYTRRTAAGQAVSRSEWKLGRRSLPSHSPPISLLKNLLHRSPPVARPRFQRHGSGKVETVPRRSGAAPEADLLQQEGTQSVRPLCRPDVRDIVPCCVVVDVDCDPCESSSRILDGTRVS